MLCALELPSIKSHVLIKNIFHRFSKEMKTIPASKSFFIEIQIKLQIKDDIFLRTNTNELNKDNSVDLLQVWSIHM